jgi:hypothetical protein
MKQIHNVTIWFKNPAPRQLPNSSMLRRGSLYRSRASGPQVLGLRTCQILKTERDGPQATIHQRSCEFFFTSICAEGPWKGAAPGGWPVQYTPEAGPGFVEHHDVDLLAFFERLAVLDQDAAASAEAGSDHDRRRGCEPQRARAGDDKDSDGGNEALIDVAGEDIPAHRC